MFLDALANVREAKMTGLELSVLQGVIAGGGRWFGMVLVQALLGAWCLVQPLHHPVLVLVRAVGHAAQLT